MAVLKHRGMYLYFHPHSCLDHRRDNLSPYLEPRVLRQFLSIHIETVHKDL